MEIHPRLRPKDNDSLLPIPRLIVSFIMILHIVYWQGGIGRKTPPAGEHKT
jgi:hypothetical protein